MSASKDYPPNYKANKFVNMGFKKCIYKTKSAAGKNVVGRGATDFINKAHLGEHKMATYNFEIFGHGTANEFKEDSKAYSKTNEFSNYPKSFDQKFDAYKDPETEKEILVDIATPKVDNTIITPYESNKKKNNTSSSNSGSDILIDLSGNTNNDDGIIVDFKKN